VRDPLHTINIIEQVPPLVLLDLASESLVTLLLLIIVDVDVDVNVNVWPLETTELVLEVWAIHLVSDRRLEEVLLFVR